MHHKVGHFAFVGGIVLAIIAGLLQTSSVFFSLLLLVLGLIVGFMNVSAKEVTPFLVATIALILAGSAEFDIINALIDPLGSILTSLFGFIKLFVAPAALVVSLKSIIALAHS